MLDVDLKYWLNIDFSKRSYNKEKFIQALIKTYYSGRLSEHLEINKNSLTRLSNKYFINKHNASNLFIKIN